MIRRFRSKPLPPRVIAVLLGIVTGSGTFGVWRYVTRPEAPHDFESCVAAGYPIMETYPEYCMYGTQGFIKGQ